MTYQELNKEVQNKLSEIIEDCGVFFAFSEKQFEEGAKGKPKSDFTNIGMGGIVPKKNAAKYEKQSDKLTQWYTDEVKKLNPVDVIRYELNNHEAYYTGDIEDTFDVVKGFGYTREQVRKVFRNKKLKEL